MIVDHSCSSVIDEDEVILSLTLFSMRTGALICFRSSFPSDYFGFFAFSFKNCSFKLIDTLIFLLIFSSHIRMVVFVCQEVDETPFLPFNTIHIIIVCHFDAMFTRTYNLQSLITIKRTVQCIFILK